MYNLLFHDFQQFHGAGLDTDAAGDALGSGILRLQNHDLHGAGLDTFAAADTLLFVDHVYAGLRVLGNGLVLAGTHALATLDAGLCFGTGALGNDLDAAQIGIKFLIKGSGAGTDTLQAGHAFYIFLGNKLLHDRDSPSLHSLVIDIHYI